MADIVLLDSGARAPDDLPEKLRALADAVERREVTALVAAYVRVDQFEFLYSASVSNGMELATLLHSRCLERYRR